MAKQQLDPLDLEMFPPLLKMDEVAQILRVDRKYAYEMARRKGFPVMNIGSEKRPILRVAKVALLNWFESEYGVKVIA
ncbi:helix-turn-helix domain-containing protein [Brevibacillus reuszeri]|uniref:helix-turn-helix domain-containing protein n=1 Tax=Brevibacillus reuszeri TaxID=54915 RepID=UPI0013DEA027|nr:helix-turn-helix domain-containing protein [Brevibacillus reuszeri]